MNFCSTLRRKPLVTLMSPGASSLEPGRKHPRAPHCTTQTASWCQSPHLRRRRRRQAPRKSALRSLLKQLTDLLEEGKPITCEHVTNILHCEADAATLRLLELVDAQLLEATSEAGVRLEPGLPVLGRSGLPAPQLRLALSALVRHCGLGPLPP